MTQRTADRTVTILVNTLIVIALGLSGWALRATVVLEKDVAVLQNVSVSAKELAMNRESFQKALSEFQIQQVSMMAQLHELQKALDLLESKLDKHNDGRINQTR